MKIEHLIPGKSYPVCVKCFKGVLQEETNICTYCGKVSSSWVDKGSIIKVTGIDKETGEVTLGVEKENK